MPLSLVLYEDYTRRDVHDIFDPTSTFTPQAGTWGLQGYVPIPRRVGDFVFFVTYGRQQGDHIFDEGITEDGVLTWQSQPQQTLNNPVILQWINHDELTNSIYLFLRTGLSGPYTYLGKLKYLSHDGTRERPVHFQWQILDWNIPPDVVRSMGLNLQQPVLALPAETIPQGLLVETPLPAPQTRQGVNTTNFRSRRNADYSLQDSRNRQLGLAGERLVIRYEKQKLIDRGRPDLADGIRHISELEGDGAGYDIESYTQEGQLKYIEVKTTRGVAVTPFYMTKNELEFSRSHSDNYHLYRVYEYDRITNSGRFFVIQGDVRQRFDLIPTQYILRQRY